MRGFGVKFHLNQSQLKGKNMSIKSKKLHPIALLDRHWKWLNKEKNLNLSTNSQAIRNAIDAQIKAEEKQNKG